MNLFLIQINSLAILKFNQIEKVNLMFDLNLFLRKKNLYYQYLIIFFKYRNKLKN